jgi:hypothetical protein
MLHPLSSSMALVPSSCADGPSFAILFQVWGNKVQLVLRESELSVWSFAV